MAEIKISSLPVANTLSANDRVVVLVNPATAANVRTITAANFGASLVSSNAIPVANTTQLGVVKVDGITITISNGTITGASNTGNIRFVNNTITSVVNGDITISPNTGLVSLPGLRIPVGTVVQSTVAIDPVIADVTLLNVVSYSTNSSSIPINTYGNPSEIPAPWAVYRLTATPSPALQVDDIIGGTGIPGNSALRFVGSGGFSDHIIGNKTFLGAPAANGVTITVTRPTVNPSFAITTGNTTDIALLTGSNGHIAVNSDIIPLVSNEYRLGTPAKRFKEVWIGAGTLYVLDETLGIDQALGARDGNFYIKGGSGLEVGQFTFTNNSITIANNQANIFFGNSFSGGGYLIFNKPVQIISNSSNTPIFRTEESGTVTITSDVAANSQTAALEVIGSLNGTTVSPNNTGVMVHLTGLRDNPSRIYNDSYGNTVYSAYIGRHARGTADAPGQTLAGDIISRIGSNPYTTNGYAAISTSRMDFVNRQDQTATNRGSEIQFWTTANNSNVIVKRVTINEDGLTYADGSKQNTAFSNTSAVTRINVGAGLTQTANVGIVGIDATGVLSVAGTNNQVLVANSGQNITLSLPQSIGTNSIVQFNTLTVQNLTVTGNSTIANSTSISDKVFHLAFDSSNSSQIDGGGFTLGNTSSDYFVSFTYNLANDYWDTNGAGLKTLDLIASNVSANETWIENRLHVGAAYIGYDFPNAIIQADGDNNGYTQAVLQNHSNGTQASADFVVVNDIGNDSNNYVDLGINSSTYANADYSIVGPNDGYLYINGGDFAVGTQTPATGLVFFAGGTTANDRIGSANSSGWFLDRLTVSNTIVGTANNTAFVGTVAATNVVSNAQLQSNLANYQTTAGLAANVVILTANAAGFLGNSSGTLANITSWISGNAATAYSNAINNFSGTYQTTAGLAANVATLTANNTAFVGNVAAVNVVSNTQLQSNLTSYQTIVGLAANVVLLTSNSTNFVGAIPAANIVSNAQLQGNLANYVSTSQLSSNLANYQTTAGLAANVVLLTSNAANFIGSLPAANVVSNAQLQGNLASYVTGTNLTANLVNYQTTAGLSANVATLTANNTLFLGGVDANAYVNTSGSYTVTGVHTHDANVVIGSNAGIVANGSVGLAGQYLTSNGSSVYWSNNVPKMLVYSIDVDKSLSTANTPQSLFGVGVTLNSDTRYRYKIYGTVFKSNTSGLSTGALRFAITNSTANAVIGHNYYLSNPCAANNSQSALVTAFQVSQSINTGFSTMTTITNSNTGATWYSFVIDGTIDINTGGTLNPQISFTHSNGTLGSATVLQAGSTIELWPIGNVSSNAVIGNWA